MKQTDPNESDQSYTLPGQILFRVSICTSLVGAVVSLVIGFVYKLGFCIGISAGFAFVFWMAVSAYLERPGTIDIPSDETIFLNPKGISMGWIYYFDKQGGKSMPSPISLPLKKVTVGWAGTALQIRWQGIAYELGRGDRFIPAHQWLLRKGVPSAEFGPSDEVVVQKGLPANDSAA
jgi:hypothetical protein